MVDSTANISDAANQQARDYAIAAARAAAAVKATHIAAIDVSQRLGLSDIFLIAAGSTDRQVRAIVDSVDEAMHECGVKRIRREGWEDAHWVLLDYGDIIVHVFQDDDREYYALDKLWKDCPSVDLPADVRVIDALSSSAAVAAAHGAVQTAASGDATAAARADGLTAATNN